MCNFKSYTWQLKVCYLSTLQSGLNCATSYVISLIVIIFDLSVLYLIFFPLWVWWAPMYGGKTAHYWYFDHLRCVDLMRTPFHLLVTSLFPVTIASWYIGCKTSWIAQRRKAHPQNALYDHQLHVLQLGSFSFGVLIRHSSFDSWSCYLVFLFHSTISIFALWNAVIFVVSHGVSQSSLPASVVMR